ncbi:unnamed protein product [Gongylonema pulchrum]|uniref:CortBP2 domain-containing protein n=1 Tax=Gongylonema pulchrum TaxID=637853 RepID=A0A183CVC4_9BILA|nr:unnamed protein product [Gongylonema pulchrum]
MMSIVVKILAAAEKRHARILRELDEAKQRSAADAAQGDDLCALLETERTRLRQQLEYEQKESDKIRMEVKRLEKKLCDEKERHKSMVLFLINERKQMLLGVHEMNIQNDHGISQVQEASLIAEMRKEVSALRLERDQLRTALEATRSEVQAYKEVIRNQEEDLALMRNNILANTRNYNNNLRWTSDGSVVVVNKGVSTVQSPSRNSAPGLPPTVTDLRHPVRPRLTNSSTFPASDRIPPSRVPLPAASSRTAASAIPPSPTKRGYHHTSATRPTTPSTVRGTVNSHSHDRVRMSSSSDTPERMKSAFSTEPEIEQLGAVIESMNTTSKFFLFFDISSSMSDKRSASLPRNSKNGGVISAQLRKNVPPKNVFPVKRNAIFKALGVSTRNDRNGS